MSLTVTVVVPTYCERENLPHLVPRVDAALRGGNLHGEILVVDDDSQDGTVEVCQELARRYPLRLEVRKGERGLASAVVHGFGIGGGEVFVVMDADLSHPPEKIPELVHTLLYTNADFVIGSRYVPGAATADGWGKLRRLNSTLGTLLARLLTSVHDPMAGFFAVSRGTLRNSGPLDPVGYKIALELLVKCRCRHVVEIPITFSDRRYGQSKLNLSEQLNYLRHVIRLLRFKYAMSTRFFCFCLVGMSGAWVDLATFLLLMIMCKMSFGIARAVSIWLAMTWNFGLNRRFTFKPTQSQATWTQLGRQYAGFCAACLLGAIVNWCISLPVSQIMSLTVVGQALAALLGIVSGLGFNFAFCRRFVFSEVAFERPAIISTSPRRSTPSAPHIEMNVAALPTTAGATNE